jgi:hypothetical protein
VVALEESLAGSNLQYGWVEYNLFSMNLSDSLSLFRNSPYIASDEKLRVRFEARLEKPGNDAECIIC